MYYIKYRVR